MANRPLYRELAQKRVSSPRQHTGLYYDKFVDTWDIGFNGLDKQGWLKQFTQAGDAQWIASYAERLAAMTRQLDGLMLVMENTDRWVIGQGHTHPTESGMLWHPTLGTPYLPGSSIKGAVRAWATLVDWPDRDQLFGSEKQPQQGSSAMVANEKSGQAGSIIFADAVPLKPVTLSLDIMNPHYGAWYRRQPNATPDDLQQPVPIPFLTVSPHQLFLFSFIPRASGDSSRLPAVRQLVIDALSWGIGAKTALGYGVFRLDEQQTSQWQARADAAVRPFTEGHRPSLPPCPVPGADHLWPDMIADGYANEQFMERLTTKWLKEMESPERPEADRLAIAQLLAHWYQTVRPNDFKRPKGKNLEKVRRIQAVLNRKKTGE